MSLLVPNSTSAVDSLGKFSQVGVWSLLWVLLFCKYKGSFLWDRFANVIVSVATYSMISVSTIDFCNTVMKENGSPHISL